MKNVKIRKDVIKKILFHTFIWLIYILIIWGINLLSGHIESYFKAALVFFPYCIVFYINVYCFYLYERKGILWSLSILLSFLLLIGITGYIYIYRFLPQHGITLFQSENFNLFLQNALINYFHFSTLSVLYYYIQKTRRTSKRLVEIEYEKLLVEQQKFRKELENENLKRKEIDMEKEKIQYEYALLKAQINPHFLHNTLNVLFSQAIDYSDDLANNILKLSRMMRYSIESIDLLSGKINIEREIEHLETLLEIHKLRFDESLYIHYIISGAPSGQLVPPLSIVTIVENAFKYGDLKDEDFPMQIKIDLGGPGINFSCVNKKKRNIVEVASTHIGLKNLKRRLEIYFQNRHNLEIVEDANFFTVHMQIENQL